MLPLSIDNSLTIAASMMLLPCGHPDALPEVQRQMRLINQAYRDPDVLRCTDDVVRAATVLHGPPDNESEDSRRLDARLAVRRLRNLLERLPAPKPPGQRRRQRSSA